ncbi:hypothetical protein K2173_020862 [Erythroxylum novogranatense]|uniref:Uncharacterized protein n=1 Tax=Erythroxylum novogranatense TaxID=1862640 RepID=A0AAV8TLY8_9ROSI|nr:hypothetical protein K2173_020862 [Erythroxylum novogranatense]
MTENTEKITKNKEDEAKEESEHTRSQLYAVQYFCRWAFRIAGNEEGTSVIWAFRIGPLQCKSPKVVSLQLSVVKSA